MPHNRGREGAKLCRHDALRLAALVRPIGMRRILALSSILLTTAAARPARAQFHFTHRDTLPQKVVQRALDGFNHHDVVAVEAEYQPMYLYENLSDSTGPHLTSRVAMRDSLILV